ncbi:MAG: FAD-dependent oxidoreductase [bacterium]
MKRTKTLFLILITIAVVAILTVPLLVAKNRPIAIEAAAEGSQSSSVLTPYIADDGDVVLFNFENSEQADRFVYGNVNTYVELTGEEVRKGKYSCAATYYVGAIRQEKRAVFYTLLHPARGRISDWSPFTEFQAAIMNSENFTVALDVEYSDGTNAVWRRYNLPPGVWSRLRQPLADLKKSGLDLSHLKRISWSQLDSRMVDINTLYFDDVRLTGADQSASKQIVEAAWSLYEEWVNGEGSQVRATYIPIIHDSPARISEISKKYDCGHIDGYVTTDVCVVGGGMAGSSAAIASGRLGVDTLLVEQYEFLGGMATSGMVMPFMSNRIGNRDLVKGIYEDIVDALIARGGAKRDINNPGVIPFDKEQLKYVLNEMVIGAGTKMMLHTWAETPLINNGTCEGIIVDNKSGRLAILAKIVIDTTGDGDMASKAGAPFELGRGYDEYTQSTTLFFRMAGVNTNVAFSELNARLDKTGGIIPANYMFADIFNKAVSEGRFPSDIPINTIFFERTLGDGVVSINATRAFEVDGTKATDLTYASVETRRQAIELSDFLKKNVPGFSHAWLQETGVQVGVRESRRILGEYQLTGKDILHGRTFPDVIARGSFGIDIHCADYSGCGVVGLELPEGASYDIPYRCLVPKNVNNMILGGRCISVTHVGYGSVRIMPICSGTGHAAGVAAALCVLRGIDPRKLSYADLRAAMIEQGADL